MPPIEPHHAPDAVDEAGRILKDSTAPEDRRAAALAIVDNWRASHHYPLNAVTVALQKKVLLIAAESDSPVRRLKRLPSIRGKLDRIERLRLSEYQDIGGCRAVLPSLAHVHENGVKVIACVGAGWNATARGASGYDPDRDGLAFPYYPVVVGDDPAAFEQFLRETARVALDRPGFERDLLFLGPWNEWTEGCYLLPDTRHRLGKLEAVRRVKDELTARAPDARIPLDGKQRVGCNPVDVVAPEKGGELG
jgi:hypothetical protein